MGRKSKDDGEKKKKKHHRRHKLSTPVYEMSDDDGDDQTPTIDNAIVSAEGFSDSDDTKLTFKDFYVLMDGISNKPKRFAPLEFTKALISFGQTVDPSLWQQLLGSANTTWSTLQNRYNDQIVQILKHEHAGLSLRVGRDLLTSSEYFGPSVKNNMHQLIREAVALSLTKKSFTLGYAMVAVLVKLFDARGTVAYTKAQRKVAIGKKMCEMYEEFKDNLRKSPNQLKAIKWKQRLSVPAPFLKIFPMALDENEQNELTTYDTEPGEDDVDRGSVVVERRGEVLGDLRVTTSEKLEAAVIERDRLSDLCQQYSEKLAAQEKVVVILEKNMQREKEDVAIVTQIRNKVGNSNWTKISTALKFVDVFLDIMSKQSSEATDTELIVEIFGDRGKEFLANNAISNDVLNIDLPMSSQTAKQVSSQNLNMPGTSHSAKAKKTHRAGPTQTGNVEIIEIHASQVENNENDDVERGPHIDMGAYDDGVAVTAAAEVSKSYRHAKRVKNVVSDSEPAVKVSRTQDARQSKVITTHSSSEGDRSDGDERDGTSNIRTRNQDLSDDDESQKGLENTVSQLDNL